MRYNFSFSLPALLVAGTFLLACNNDTVTRQAKQAAINARQDSIRVSENANQKKVKMLEPARYFYSWYSVFLQKYPNTYFVKKENGHYVIDVAKFGEYWQAFKDGGWASDEMITKEKNFYATCAERWAKETAGAIPSGLEKDRYYGTAKYDVNDYLFSGVTMMPDKNDYGDLLLQLKNGLQRKMRVHYNGTKWQVESIE